MNLSGATVRKEHVLSLAAMVDGDLAAKLNRAIANGNTIVALSAVDRQQLLKVLDGTTPGGLLELRNVLVKQDALERRREAQADRVRRDQERLRSRDPGREGAAAPDDLGDPQKRGV
jgi:hypothetical protein